MFSLTQPAAGLKVFAAAGSCWLRPATAPCSVPATDTTGRTRSDRPRPLDATTAAPSEREIERLTCRGLLLAQFTVAYNGAVAVAVGTQCPTGMPVRGLRRP